MSRIRTFYFLILVFAGICVTSALYFVSPLPKLGIISSGVLPHYAIKQTNNYPQNPQSSKPNLIKLIPLFLRLRTSRVNNVYKFMVPEKYIEKMLRIKEEAGISIAQQIKMGMEEYLFKYEMSKSPFMRNLGEFRMPKIGETLSTDDGRAEILSVKHYDEILDEFELDGHSKEEISDFAARIEHFLGNKERYFECEIRNQDGEIERIDWSEYLAFKNKKVILRQNQKKSISAARNS